MKNDGDQFKNFFSCTLQELGMHGVIVV